ncbi:hypothetical protein Tco_0887948 [Tanacetum coccineum]
MSWSWKHLLNLRDKIKEFVNVKLGNGKTCSLWFDKWHPGGPLSKLIDHMMIYMAGLDINAKVIDLIDNNSWCWPIDWVGEYDSVLNVPVPKLVNDLEDKPVWCNKKSCIYDWDMTVLENIKNIRYGAGILSRVIGFKVIYVGIAAAYNVSGLACFGTVMVYVADQVMASGHSDWNQLGTCPMVCLLRIRR